MSGQEKPKILIVDDIEVNLILLETVLRKENATVLKSMSGFDALEALALVSPGIMESLGMRLHFDSISRGVADTRDIIYFISVILFFLLLTKINLERK